MVKPIADLKYCSAKNSNPHKPHILKRINQISLRVELAFERDRFQKSAISSEPSHQGAFM
jgi:hypothetical protein